MLSLAGQLVQAPAFVMYGAIHRRNLFALADKFRENLMQAPLPTLRDIGFFKRLSKRIARCRPASGNNRADIRLALVRQKRNEARRLPDRNRQNAGRLRIQRAQMSDADVAIARI